MFLPIHDHNNEPVKIFPVVCYTVMALCFAVHIYLFILTTVARNPQYARLNFLYSHGMVPVVYFSGDTTYQIGTREMHIAPEDLQMLKDLPEDSGARYLAELMEINTNWFWIFIMPLTATLIHADWLHLMTNIWFFWIFSDNVEEKFGSFLFLLFYLSGGCFSSLVFALLRADVSTVLIGASGAVFAVMGAYIVLFPRNRVTSYVCPVWFFIRRVDLHAIFVLGMFFLIDIVRWMQQPESAIAFDAHISGFLFGVVVAAIIKSLQSSTKSATQS